MNFNPNMNNSAFGANNPKGINPNFGNVPNLNNNVIKNVSIFSAQQAAKSRPGGIFANSNGISSANYNAFSASAQGRAPKPTAENNADGGIMAALKSMFTGEPQAKKGDVITNARLVLARAESLTGSAEAQELLEKAKEKEQNGGKDDDSNGQKLNIDMA